MLAVLAYSTVAGGDVSATVRGGWVSSRSAREEGKMGVKGRGWWGNELFAGFGEARRHFCEVGL